MLLEHAILPVRSGSETEFEAAFTQARPPNQRAARISVPLLVAIDGIANLYLLLVERDSVEAHTDGFRTSPEYESWKALLHHFYDPFPVVEHFVPTKWLPSV
jgi:heme-degrading monooxygenase HmoA